MARILVDYGAAVDATNGAGQTALHIAAAEGDEPLVKYFYGVRANAAIADNEGKSSSSIWHKFSSVKTVLYSFDFQCYNREHYNYFLKYSSL